MANLEFVCDSMVLSAKHYCDSDEHSFENGTTLSRGKSVPVISKFFGIVIYMYWKDHAPPHFHARYGDDEIVVEIKSGNVSGNMSNRAVKMVQEWRELYKEELLKNWELAEQKKALCAINPLE